MSICDGQCNLSNRRFIKEKQIYANTDSNVHFVICGSSWFAYDFTDINADFLTCLPGGKTDI